MDKPLSPAILANAIHDTAHESTGVGRAGRSVKCGPTHHYACDCREAHFADLERQLASAEAERDRLLNVRPGVRAFAIAMEAKLRANDHKGGWQDDPIEYFFNRLTEEMMELGSAICRDEGVRGEAVDVANFAMMIFARAALKGDADGQDG